MFLSIESNITVRKSILKGQTKYISFCFSNIVTFLTIATVVDNEKISNGQMVGKSDPG